MLPLRARSQSFEDVKPLFRRVFERYGLPKFIRTDNGAPFATKGFAGLSKLSVWWIKLGITPQRIQPGKPYQQGIHERMHRTLKRETAMPPKEHLKAQQIAFDKFQQEFNNIRPHEALQDKTPAEIFEPSPKPMPSREPEPNYPINFTVKQVKGSGNFNIISDNIYLSTALGGEFVGFEEFEEGLWRLYLHHLPLALFDSKRKKLLKFQLTQEI